MKLILLSEKFYSDYPKSKYPELMNKENRPYCCITINVENRTFGIPLRHHIQHPFAFFTMNEAGLDFTKAVAIDNPDYISSEKPWINADEWNILRLNENLIYYKFRKYLRDYKRAFTHLENPRSKAYLQYSTLWYFI